MASNSFIKHSGAIENENTNFHELSLKILIEIVSSVTEMRVVMLSMWKRAQWLPTLFVMNYTKNTN